jgi:hypothetical protein
MANPEGKILRCLPAVSSFNPVEKTLELSNQEWTRLLRSFREIDIEHPECELENWLIINSTAAGEQIIVNLNNDRRGPAISS